MRDGNRKGKGYGVVVKPLYTVQYFDFILKLMGIC